MWPFDHLSSNDEEEDCDHEWEEHIEVMTHPKYIHHVAEEENEVTEPYIRRVATLRKQCNKCNKSEIIERSEKRIYLAVERVEPVE